MVLPDFIAPDMVNGKCFFDHIYYEAVAPMMGKFSSSPPPRPSQYTRLSDDDTLQHKSSFQQVNVTRPEDHNECLSVDIVENEEGASGPGFDEEGEEEERLVCTSIPLVFRCMPKCSASGWIAGIEDCGHTLYAAQLMRTCFVCLH